MSAVCRISAAALSRLAANLLAVLINDRLFTVFLLGHNINQAHNQCILCTDNGITIAVITMIVFGIWLDLTCCEAITFRAPSKIVLSSVNVINFAYLN